ncbi:hypothetical protein [Nocardia sp. NPDC058705]|uniref:hypothetical protein n=1 Tax=Nocardia sp. NPDC058705 TaxID=3346609 RepID=UPI00367D45A6
MKAIAIGFLRSDISGHTQSWDEIRIRSQAKRYGYDLAKTIVFNAGTPDPIAQLIDIVRRSNAEAVFTPHRDHLGPEIPERLVQVCDVITVADQSTFARCYFDGEVLGPVSNAVLSAKAWFAWFDSDDRAEAMAEIQDAAELAVHTGDSAPLTEVLQAWATTAAVMRDPARRAVHTGSGAESEFVEVDPPASPSPPGNTAH